MPRPEEIRLPLTADQTAKVAYVPSVEEANLEDSETRKLASHQEQLDAVESIFQMHASGLKNAFECLKEQHYELLVSTGALSRQRLNINGNPRPVEEQLKPVEEQREATGMLKNSSPEQVGGDEAGADAKAEGDCNETIDETAGTADDPTGELPDALRVGSKYRSRLSYRSQNQEERQLQQQFSRLDVDGSTEIDEGVLVALMAGYGEDFEVENIPALVTYISKLEGNDSGLNFRNFVVLMTDTRLTEHPTPKSIQYEVSRLREGLQKEADASLHKDLTDVSEGPGPRGRYKQMFDLVPACIITLNAITIGVSNDVDQNAQYWLGFETLFFVCYLIEALAKLKLYGCTWYFFGEEKLWNVFDISCVALSGVDVAISFAVMFSDAESPLSVLMILKILRLTRLARLVRTLRLEMFKELKIMVMGVLSGMRVLGWAMVLLFILIYVFGMAFSNFLSDQEPEFATVDASMFTLFRCFSDACDGFNGKPLIPRLHTKYGVTFLISYILMWMTIVLGVFNLIMAVFVDTVMEDHLSRKMRSIADSGRRFEVDVQEHLLRLILNSRSSMVPQDVKTEIESIGQAFSNRAVRVRAQFQCLAHASVVISRSAFDVYMSDKKFLHTLTEAEIEVDHGSNIFDFLDADMGGWLTAMELLQGLVSLRGPVSKPEIVGIRLKIRHIIKMLHHQGMTEAHE